MSQNETNYDAAFVHYVNDCQDKCKMLSQNIVSLAYHNRTQAEHKQLPEGYTMKKVQHSRDFFVLAGLTKPKPGII